MAYAKIISLKKSLNKAIDYTLNEEKTDLKSAIAYATNKDKSSDERTIFEDTINCLKEDAFEKMNKKVTNILNFIKQ